mmetsp:Transcript_48291/g.116991  ORF Transcript_48291/g.116991 Transcript_48291/m.116991 type:complete len:457 (-) Transcript_48291:223-1593(-)
MTKTPLSRRIRLSKSLLRGLLMSGLMLLSILTMMMTMMMLSSSVSSFPVVPSMVLPTAITRSRSTTTAMPPPLPVMASSLLLQQVCRTARTKNCLLLGGDSRSLYYGQRCDQRGDHSIQRTITGKQQLRKTRIVHAVSLMGKLVAQVALKNESRRISSKQRRISKTGCIHQHTVHQIILKRMKNLRRTVTTIAYGFVLLFGSIFYTGAVQSVQPCHASLPSPSSAIVETTTLMSSTRSTTPAPIGRSDMVVVATAVTTTAASEGELVELERHNDDEKEEEEEEISKSLGGEVTSTKHGEQRDLGEQSPQTDVAATEERTSNHEAKTGDSPTVVAKILDSGENFISPVAATVVGSGTVFLLRKQNNSPREENDDGETTQDTVQDVKKVTAPAAAVATTTSQMTELLPLMTKKYIDARSQPKSFTEESTLADKYASIPDVGDRAFQILLDLGMIESSS